MFLTDRRIVGTPLSEQRERKDETTLYHSKLTHRQKTPQGETPLHEIDWSIRDRNGLPLARIQQSENSNWVQLFGFKEGYLGQMNKSDQRVINRSGHFMGFGIGILHSLVFR